LPSQSLNAHWAFHQAPKSNDFLNAINVRENEYRVLRLARDEVRATLRTGLATWQTIIAKDQLFVRDLGRNGVSHPILRPRFRMQGSFAYHTANDPAQSPQQIDLDDGMYMPTEFISAQSGHRPILASKGYFQAVESILQPLCTRKGWKLIAEKKSCIRIEISHRCHIDIALYAIPAAQFNQLSESLATDHSVAKALRDSDELREEFYRQLPHDQVMLAHRENGWQPSDPRKIEDWYQRAIDTYGQVLRRLSRYFKAWRDYQWQTPKLSSLAIMACVVDIFDKLRVDVPDNRDDIAVLLVTERFADRLNQQIPNPVLTGVPEVALDRDWSAADRAEIVGKAKELHKRLCDALVGTDDPATVLAYLRTALGKRITNDVSVIRAETRETTVKSFPKITVAAPIVGRSTSG